MTNRELIQQLLQYNMDAEVKLSINMKDYDIKKLSYSYTLAKIKKSENKQKLNCNTVFLESVDMSDYQKSEFKNKVNVLKQLSTLQ